MNHHLHYSRRQILQSSVGLAGLTLPSWMQMQAATEQAVAAAPSAKSCIVLFLWGGLAQQESFDPKPGLKFEILGYEKIREFSKKKN